MIKWNCSFCGNKLPSRKEKILKVCNFCALEAKNTLKDKNLDVQSKFFMLISSSSVNSINKKEKKLLIKTLEDDKKRLEVFVEWKKNNLSPAKIREELEPFVPDKLLEEVVFHYHAITSTNLFIV